ncbi:MAG: hypothetical protein ALAOOOJD_01583 [bacterium]|nr:hypothetical protein [bacterium]
MSKRIVICSDGTWFTPEHKAKGVIAPSNVYKMACAITPQAADGNVQIVFYDKGVGTGWGLDRLTGGAFGQGLFDNIKDAYFFLVQNYADGDEIYFLGFSRGAYTVRSTVGLIRKCGLLHKIHADKFIDAYRLYRRRDPTPDAPDAIQFRKDYAREIRVKFIGVWDTVGALGIPFGFLRFLTRSRYQFHDVKLSGIVENAYHAVAIDEQRTAFKPTLWELPHLADQKVEQVWFAGVHNNIGGGYQDSGLSDLAFLWIKEKAASCGLRFDPAYIEKTIKPDYAGVIPHSFTAIFYKMVGANKPRAIAQHTGTAESVHPSALARFNDATFGYHPKNLIDYLKLRGG